MTTWDDILCPYMKILIEKRYIKKFAYLPIRDKARKFIWFRHYYGVYKVYYCTERSDVLYHRYNLTVGDAVIEKLCENH